MKIPVVNLQNVSMTNINPQNFIIQSTNRERERERERERGSGSTKGEHPVELLKLRSGRVGTYNECSHCA
jgi:hypothetical protein